jgi:hypothetical protein
MIMLLVSHPFHVLKDKRTGPVTAKMWFISNLEIKEY